MHARWATAELAPWRGRELTRAAIDARITAAAGHGGLFRYDISATTVTCSQKRGEFLGPGVDAAILADVLARAESYRALLEQCLPFLHIEAPFSLAIDVSDIAPIIPDLPLFCFQKPADSPLILLPDIDLIRLDYLEAEEWIDQIPFAQKIDKAVFVGSTTGAKITQEVVRSLSLPRLRAAAAFRGSPHIDFFLPRIVQCDSAKTEAMVRDLDVGGRAMAWTEQLAYRHLISMDGNGAACSRMAIALNSNSVLVKYDSPHQLFYFRGLQPGVHYLAVSRDGEVEALFDVQARSAARHQRIAEQGQAFARRYLRREPCVHYVVALLKQYLHEINLAEGRSDVNRRARRRYVIAAARRPIGRLRRALKPWTTPKR